MSDDIVTKDQIIRLIRDEKLRPEDFFSQEALSEWQHRAEIERRLEAEKKAEAERDKNESPNAKYIDPRRNSFIKTA